MMEKRIEKNISRTAEYTCSSRAASYFEENPCYHSEDYIATLLVPWFVRYPSRLGFFRRLFLSKFAPKGIYEYVIARTKYIDHVFTQSVAQGVEQVVIFGAGFDTRSIRLLRKDSPVKVFEVDAEVTQKAKLRRLGEVGVPVPENTVHVSVDFNREDPEEKLTLNGFQHGKRCLFILEGLLMYLDEDAVNKTFRLIQRLSGPGSLVVFDYVYSSVIDRHGRYYGEGEIRKTVANAGEPWTFGFDEGTVEDYLVDKGFRLVEECSNEVLEQRYFTGYDGSKVGRINGTHCLVLAEVG